MYKTSDYVNYCIRCMYTCTKKSIYMYVYMYAFHCNRCALCYTSDRHRRLAPPALWDEVSAHLVDNRPTE